MHKATTVLAAMSPFPHTVEAHEALAAAKAVMDTHDIHHVPVLDGDALVGLLTSADLARAGGGTVGDACHRDVLVVDVHRALASACREMAARRVDAALVTKDGHLAGILTVSDVCRFLADLLDPDLDDEIA
ncbi:MAG: CBS domain-containing protein [Myxococcales bacterium]|nr:CBS domain-containing protein [Myxococcales bacterium]MCB9734493.1 CBS domain-containing protein [Deltaproteobacteria bacterium]